MSGWFATLQELTTSRWLLVCSQRAGRPTSCETRGNILAARSLSPRLGLCRRLLLVAHTLVLPERLRFLKVYSEPWHQSSRLECCKLPQVPLSRKKVLGSSGYTQMSTLIPDCLNLTWGRATQRVPLPAPPPLSPFLQSCTAEGLASLQTAAAPRFVCILDVAPAARGPSDLASNLGYLCGRWGENDIQCPLAKLLPKVSVNEAS